MNSKWLMPNVSVKFTNLTHQTGRNTNSINIPDGNYILEGQLIVIYISAVIYRLNFYQVF